MRILHFTLYRLGTGIEKVVLFLIQFGTLYHTEMFVPR